MLDRVTARPGGTVWEIAQELSWSRSWAQTTGFLRRAALAETLAHLRSLSRAGLAQAAGTAPEVWRPARQSAAGSQ